MGLGLSRQHGSAIEVARDHLPISKGLARVLSAGQFILPFVIEKSCWGLISTELCTLEP